jgi:hypothetical protein
MLAAITQAVLAAGAAVSGAATSRWVYLGFYGAALTMSFAVSIAISFALRSGTGGDVPESARAARCGVHQTTCCHRRPQAK